MSSTSATLFAVLKEPGNQVANITFVGVPNMTISEFHAFLYLYLSICLHAYCCYCYTPWVQRIKRSAIMTSFYCFSSDTNSSDLLSRSTSPNMAAPYLESSMHICSITLHNVTQWPITLPPSKTNYSSRIIVIYNNNKHRCLNCSSVPKTNILTPCSPRYDNLVWENRRHSRNG